MLFTSAAFAFLYLPLVIPAFFLVPTGHRTLAASWLFLASLFFYGYWMPEYVVLLLGSIVWNYWIGLRIGEAGARTPRAKRWMIAGVTVDLLVLAWFKYAGFLATNLNALAGSHLDVGLIILPIGISFFTFTQIAFLADAYQKGVREYAFAQ
jgi:alginate O-acetyltransferase complex protein AlgI